MHSDADARLRPIEYDRHNGTRGIAARVRIGQKLATEGTAMGDWGDVVLVGCLV